MSFSFQNKSVLCVSWERTSFSKAFELIRQTRKLKSSEIEEVGSFSVIDQGQGLIAGFTNDADGLIKVGEGLIIFGDHTRKLKFVDFDFVPGADGIKILKPVKALDLKFAFYFLQSQDLPNEGYSRHFKYLKALEVPLPPLEEQKRIAGILEEADGVRKKTQALIAKYDELAQSLFLDMFGDPITNPKGWAVKPLGELCEVTNGFAFKSAKYVDSGVRIIRIANVQKGVVTDDHPKFYPLETIGDYSRFELQERDLVMSLTGNVGRVGLMPRTLLPAFLNQRVACLRPKTDQMKLGFLFQILNSDLFERQAVFNSSGVAQLNLSSKWVESFPVILPDFVLQSKFHDLLQDLSKWKIALEGILEREDVLFDSLLQKAFKGELT